MKITDYPQATELASDDSFIIDGPTNGTRHIPKENLPWGEGGSGSVPETDPEWVSHRNTYRGKSLGSVFTDEQKEAISNGTFDDLYVGDYWTIGNFDWLVADVNYWLNIGDQPKNQGCATPHLVIVPRKNLYTAKMNDSAATTGGYVGSKMYTQYLNNAKTIIYTAFGESNILDHREYFVNAVSSTSATGATWVNSKVDLMNQIMVYGSNIFYGVYGFNSDKTQLSLFRLRPDLIVNVEETYWLRDVFPPNSFARVDDSGYSSVATASYNNGVRPAFGLTGGTN